MKKILTLPDRCYDWFYTSDLSYDERQYAKAYVDALNSTPKKDPKHVSIVFLKGRDTRFITDVKYYLMLNGYLTSNYEDLTFKGSRLKSFYFNPKPKFLTRLLLSLLTLGTFKFPANSTNSDVA